MDKQEQAEIREAVAAKLRNLIAEQGHYRTDVADGAGIPRGSTSPIMRGQQSLRFEHVVALANTLGVSILYFVEPEWLDVNPIAQAKSEAIADLIAEMNRSFREAA